MLDTASIKKDFPIFQHRQDLVYLDSTATSLKPKCVIDKLSEYYSQYSANIFRGVYQISEQATREYESSREVIASFINAFSKDEIIFTRNTSESINLLAYSLGRQIVDKDDEIVTTIMEHHSNFVPWQVLAHETGAVMKVIDINDEGLLNLELEKIITKKTKILTLTYISNVLGTINPIKAIVREAKKINPFIIIIVDAAQAVPHIRVDVQELGCDFLAFSGHKMLGPTGVGVLWGKYSLLDSMYPFQYGGEMVGKVELTKTTFKKPPHKFEAGTPHIAGVIALKSAIEYLNSIGLSEIHDHEYGLRVYAEQMLRQSFGKSVNLLGGFSSEKKCGIVSFSFNDYHPHDLAQILDESQIAVRAGHHCAMPLHTRFGINASTRASFYLYNNKKDVEELVEGLKKAKKLLRES